MSIELKLRPIWPAWALAIPLVLCGCGETPAPPVADANEAKQTLDSALTAWSQGKAVAEVKDASPSIIVSDPQWESGFKLTKYQVDSEGQPSGAERAFTVTLWLADPKGKASQQEVVYKVGTDPVFTVFRSLF